VTPDPGLAAALLAGLAGSAHCLGMCGGIAGALGAAGRGRPAYALAYSTGRIASYALAGAAAGLLGARLGGLADIGPGLRLLTGALLILLGLQVAFGLRLLRPLESAGARLWRYIAPAARALMPPRHIGQALALGAVWGWLPCGLVYGMLAAAAGTGGAARGAAFMAVFGLGTVPAVAGMSLASQRVAGWFGAGRRRVLGLLLAAFGAWTLVTPLAHLAGTHDHSSHHAIAPTD
jgi:sulfite exporter TauE/SafE